MGSFLKKYFIPHEGNDHKPHILRWTTIRVALLVLVVLEGVFLAQVGFVANHSSSVAAIVESVLGAETNQNRIANSLQPLSLNPLLQEAAQNKANDMAAKGYFSHISPDGETPWGWIQAVGYSYSYAGENLAVNFVDSDDVMNAWMASPEHRANILDGNFTEMGYGIAQGEYQGQEATFVVQMFGTPPETAPIALVNPTTPKIFSTTTAHLNNQAETSTVSQRTATSASSSILGVSTVAAGIQNDKAPSQTGFIGQVLASPLSTTDYLFAAIALLFLTALALKFLVNIKIQHPSLVLNGVLMLFVINCLLLLNKYIVLSQLKVL